MLKVHVYVCNSCDKKHDEHEDAVYCCPTVGRYQCGVCQKLHERSNKADECCRVTAKRQQFVKHSRLKLVA